MAGKLNKEIMQQICDKLAMGKSLRSVCDTDAVMPHWVTVLQAIQRDDELHEMYSRARAIGAEVLADEMHDLAAMPLPDLDPRLANAEVQRRRVEIDTKKWTFSRQQPRGIRNKVEDTAANVITLSWSNAADDVSARQADESEEKVVRLVTDEAG